MPVRVTGSLHLKSAACAVDEEKVLVNRTWVETGPFAEPRLVDLPAAEPFGADVLRLPGAVLASGAFPATAEIVLRHGHSENSRTRCPTRLNDAGTVRRSHGSGC